MHFQTIKNWDERLWIKAEKIYEEAFPAHSRKKRSIIQNMFQKKMCFLHLAFIDDEIVAMALSGKIQNPHVLILDYIAVKKELQSHGFGKELINYIKSWCYGEFSLIVVEVEAELSTINEKRKQFWTKCDFQKTEYIHSYTWVPEKYQAMFYPLKPFSQPPDGKKLFSYITEFHRKGYKKS